MTLPRGLDARLLRAASGASLRADIRLLPITFGEMARQRSALPRMAVGQRQPFRAFPDRIGLRPDDIWLRVSALLGSAAWPIWRIAGRL
ncbi:hypothetical protein N5W20_00550 [Candidatus Kirkpatrickella diaphorinae]|uniref:Uncharacterized protein n=1 Tax=Candidatus Kirkpatrickella diaphorinae TaxID=2984322 RepID=A0ABY6GIR3_9PROT|nr:hypothetical protein [Candidatus Kirkpatrickella diaphorinae]UYH51408.1 hypothetical protein N5W20_00550 [Candidatus Kirkpatrickella diaphorinae]